MTTEVMITPRSISLDYPIDYMHQYHANPQYWVTYLRQSTDQRISTNVSIRHHVCASKLWSFKMMKKLVARIRNA